MQPARFVWYELMTPDIDAALAFYGRVIGWTSHDHPGGGERYAIVNANGAGVGGVTAMPPGLPKPFWLGYIGTPDLAATLAAFRGAGGQVHKGPFEIPEVGTIAIVSDPQHTPLAFIQPAGTGESQSFDQAKPGHGNWNELHAPDPAAALAFYTAQFGWEKGETHDMGPNGTYQIIRAAGADIGGIVKTGWFGPSWIFYFGTPDPAAAAEAIRDAGGEVLHGPSPVPGGAHIVVARDPAGAAFALVGPGH